VTFNHLGHDVKYDGLAPRAVEPMNGEAGTGRRIRRSREEIREMLEEAISRRQTWNDAFAVANSQGERRTALVCARNSKALEGVEKTLRWILSDPDIIHPLD